MEALLDQLWTSHAQTQTRPKPRAARWAVATLFFINGALLATWVSRIPAVQAAHGLGNGALGLALLAMALGAVVAMPLVGSLMTRFGSDQLSRITVLIYCAMLPCLILAPSTAMFFVALFLFGASHGALDVAMNAQAVAVEKQYRAPIMSSLHALFSTGGFVGAGLGSLLAGNRFTSLLHFSLIAVVLGAVALLTFPQLLQAEEQHELGSTSDEEQRARFPMPSRGLLALGAVALCTMVGEGAMADWSAVYLRNVIRTTEGLSAAGYVAFSIAMLVGRFFGDWLTARVDSVRLVRISGTVAAAGLSVALLTGQPGAILVGFACVGVGFSTVVPMVFSAAGRSPNVAPSVALASVTTMGYLGFLAGPPFIGFVAELFGLRMALGIIVATSLLIIALAPSVRRAASEKR